MPNNQDIVAGSAGFCLNLHAFLEFAEGSDAWRLWAADNNMGRENSVFFSAHSYGMAQVRRHLQGGDIETGRANQVFNLLRTSSLSARIIPDTAEIMDIAADTLAIARTSEGWKEENVTPFIEYATAYSSNLTLVVTDAEDDPGRNLPPLLHYPVSVLTRLR